MLASKMDKEDQIDLEGKDLIPKPNRAPAGMDSAWGSIQVLRSTVAIPKASALISTLLPKNSRTIACNTQSSEVMHLCFLPGIFPEGRSLYRVQDALISCQAENGLF